MDARTGRVVDGHAINSNNNTNHSTTSTCNVYYFVFEISIKAYIPQANIPRFILA
ncbi:hypothetical protein TRIATDRAFT_257448 [Trichoderma atroviride IMI 206040]|uniref:Uncharacterized protein n=1 Tax=Hypocrea atroviridis (strain ATCC 20476 / IMI 206040) TaxID=452589 RepID=G9NX77_HYPAI|nr:uncharacterized protein TRIATDRAFT_257448 [Trichoderma atroviride IMI 206040]EHK45507.1 hypothetical protein TRIATDRAFT_257448 [Trichoderma atroviride IMI 206040]